MKIELSQTAVRGEEWKRENRKPRIYPPPNDGREWILADEAAVLYEVPTKTLVDRMRRLNFTRTCRPGVKVWLVKKEVIGLFGVSQRPDAMAQTTPPQKLATHDRYEPRRRRVVQARFRTTAQAAAFMSVNRTTVYGWGKKGHQSGFLTCKQGSGGQNWYSPTSLRNLKEDEQFLKRRAAWGKAKATMRTGAVGRETLKTKHKQRVYKKVPKGWLTMMEVAERLDVSTSAVANLRRRGHLTGEHFTGEWDAKHRPWFFHEAVVEEYRTREHYKSHANAGNGQC